MNHYNTIGACNRLTGQKLNLKCSGLNLYLNHKQHNEAKMCACCCKLEKNNTLYKHAYVYVHVHINWNNNRKSRQSNNQVIIIQQTIGFLHTYAQHTSTQGHLIIQHNNRLYECLNTFVAICLLVCFCIHRQCVQLCHFFFSLHHSISFSTLFHFSPHRALFYFVQLFLSCLEAIQTHRILTDIDQSKLFSNIREICEVNIKFWTLYLYPMVSD